MKELAEEKAANNEVKILTKLKHPQIIGYYGTFKHDSCLHILMEYADGANCAVCCAVLCCELIGWLTWGAIAVWLVARESER